MMIVKHSTMMRAYAFKLMKRDPELYDKINEEVQQEFKDYLNSKRNEQDKSKPRRLKCPISYHLL